jgi:peptide/nickel transport system permease protein
LASPRKTVTEGRAPSTGIAALILRRLVFAVVLVVIASSSALLLTRAIPGDVSTELGPLARPDEAAAVRAQYGLDRHPIAQWGGWALRAVRFDFGTSFLHNRPVGPLVRQAAVNTFVLALAALLIATTLGIGLGILSGASSGWLVPLVRAVSLVALSLPPLLTSLVLVVFAARSGILPAGGMTSIDAGDMSWPAWIADVLYHLPLPAIALALPMAAVFERLQAQSLTEALEQPFIRAAAAKGVDRRGLILRHAWPTSLRPICGVYGVAVGALLSGSFIVEYITTWPGLGMLMWEALRARDIYLIAGCAAAGATFVAAGTLVGDLLLFAIDPHLRTTETA